MMFGKRLLTQPWSSPLCKMSPLLKPQRLGLFGMCYPTRSYISDNSINLNSNNFIVLDDNANDGKAPTLKFNSKSPEIDLHGNMTLREVEAEMKTKRSAK